MDTIKRQESTEYNRNKTNDQKGNDGNFLFVKFKIAVPSVSLADLLRPSKSKDSGIPVFINGKF